MNRNLRLKTIFLIAALWFFIGCNSGKPQWISEKVIQSMEFANSTPFQVFNHSSISDINTAIATQTYNLDKAFEVHYFLDGGDTAQMYAYLFNTEIEAFGAYKSLGGIVNNDVSTLIWYKNALFDFKLNNMKLFSKELRAFKKAYPFKNIPDTFEYFPLQQRVPQSEAVSMSGLLGHFQNSSFTSIDYFIDKEFFTLAKSIKPISNEAFSHLLKKNTPLESVDFDEFTVHLFELSGSSAWISRADGHLISVFGASDLKKSLNFIKKSLNIQKILN